MKVDGTEFHPSRASTMTSGRLLGEDVPQQATGWTLKPSDVDDEL